MNGRLIGMGIASLSLALGIAVDANASHIDFTFVNQQTQGAYQTGDMLVQHSDGTTEFIPYSVTATGQWTTLVEYAGSPYTAPSWAELELSGPGVDGGNYGGGGEPPPGGGGGIGDPIVITGGPPSKGGGQVSSTSVNNGVWQSTSGSGGSTSAATNPNNPIGPIILRLWAACLSSRAAAAAISEIHCRNAGGVASFNYGICGGSQAATCQNDPPPREPRASGGGGGGGGGGHSGGGGWIPLSSQGAGGGTATVGPLRTE